MVLAETDVVARLPLGAALANDDVARDHALTAKFLDAQPPARGIAAVAGGTTCLLVCHRCLLLPLGVGCGEVLGCVAFDDALAFCCLESCRVVGLRDVHRRMMGIVL